MGASLRYLVSCLLGTWCVVAFPVATFFVNLLGCFLIGLFSVFIPGVWPEKPEYLLFATTGVLGGFTTFSTFSLESLSLLQEGQYLIAGAYVLGTVALCLVGVALGRLAGQAVMGA